MAILVIGGCVNDKHNSPSSYNGCEVTIKRCSPFKQNLMAKQG